MEIVNKKRAVYLGIRIGTVFLAAILFIVVAAYYVLSQNVHSLLTDYTVKLVEAMASQGVKMVETELESGRNEVSFLADSLKAPDSEKEEFEFSQPFTESQYLRMSYVTKDRTITSDKRQRHLWDREDIRAAFAGETAIYGPYFNEENEFVICYSAPVRQSGEIIGVLSIEKDGYCFSRLIEKIRFIDSGECYLINAEGQDIAVSDQNHMEWVTGQYNAHNRLEEEMDEETKSIMELEKRGLDGEAGMGTYYWKNGLCYVLYKPVPSVGWVLLAGLREEEIASMTHSTFSSAVSEWPVLGLCLSLVLLLTILIIYWIVSSMKKTAEVNEKLKDIANHDPLTGLMNRNSYHNALDLLLKEEQRSIACVYIDANGLHEINNHLGHQAGDRMLKSIAEALIAVFVQDAVFRIGGDEFVVLSWGKTEAEIHQAAQALRQSLRSQSYEISIGVAWQEHVCSTEGIVNNAETAMQEDKKRFYQNNGKERRMRSLNKQLEKMIVEKQDADAFLAVLAPEFKGVYFVNLNDNTVRHLYIPPYFKEFLQETDNKFSQAILLYARQIVKKEYYHLFEEFCDYSKLEQQLNSRTTPEFIYQKIDGDWLKLRVLKFQDYTKDQQETLWIFANTDRAEGNS